MSGIRDLIYINYDKLNEGVWSSGIEFKEFILTLSQKPNILVLNGNYSGENFDFNTRRYYCISKEINEIISEDVYNYGDFSWIDFENISCLDNLDSQEIAELYYIANKWDSVNGKFFKTLNNRFHYIAHDDGSTNYVYYKNMDDFIEVLGNVLNNKILAIYNLELNSIGSDILTKLIELSRNGIAIDLMRLSIQEDYEIVIPIFKMSNYTDMDKVYELTREKDIVVDLELRYKTKWNLKEL